jgi:hypothetical protein
MATAETGRQIAIWILVAGWLVFRASNRPLGAPPAPAAPVA